MAKVRIPPELRGIADPGSDWTAPGFKVTQRGPGIERVESSGSGRNIEHVSSLKRSLNRAARTKAENLASEIKTVVNASGHTVKTPGGPIAYHREKQQSWLEEAKQHKVGSAIRKMAVAQAKDHGAAKRSLLRGGGRGGGSSQPRVPAGNPAGGQWTKK